MYCVNVTADGVYQRISIRKRSGCNRPERRGRHVLRLPDLRWNDGASQPRGKSSGSATSTNYALAKQLFLLLRGGNHAPPSTAMSSSTMSPRQRCDAHRGSQTAATEEPPGLTQPNGFDLASGSRKSQCGQHGSRLDQGDAAQQRIVWLPTSRKRLPHGYSGNVTADATMTLTQVGVSGLQFGLEQPQAPYCSSRIIPS